MPSEVTKEIELELAHVLFIDIVGYSKLLIETQRKLLEILNETVRGTEQFRQAEASGRLLKIPTGDGMALVFYKSPEEPAECALELARADMAHPELQLRMGIHSGPISGVVDVNGHTNVAGAGINLAQRVMDCGDAGHILVSKHVAEDLEQYGHWQPLLHDLGECEVKHGIRLHVVNLYTGELGNPESPEKFKTQLAGRSPSLATPVVPKSARIRWHEIVVALLFVAAVVVATMLFFHRAKRQEAKPTAPVMADKSIAVLPFENLSSDKENSYFADGVQDEILTDLAKIADLKVISRTSVMQYKSGTARNLREIGKQLGVAHLLEGSVQRAAGKVRVNAQLIDARTDAHLWAQTYDRNLADVFAIQSEIAKAIADQLQAKLSPTEKAAIEIPPTTDLTAYDLYTRAKTITLTASFSALTKDKFLQAIELLNQAVKRDPEFLLAYCLLAGAHDQLYFLNVDHTPTRLAMGDAAVQAALRLRPDSGEAHLARAQHLYRGYLDYDQARAEIAIAQRTLPNASLPFQLLGYIDRRQGRWNESAHAFERAIELDPRNFNALQQISLSYRNLRRFPEAIAVLDRALTIVPQDVDMRVARSLVELLWHADTRPLHKTIDAVLAQDPAAAATLADNWLELALCERDYASADRALVALGDSTWGDNAIQLSRTFGEGLVAHLRGDTGTAQAAFTNARAQQEKLVRDEPNYGPGLCILGLIDAGLGRKEEALREGRRAVEMLPVTKDAINGAEMIRWFAIIAAWTGEKDLALEQLAIAAKIPNSVSYGPLSLSPFWDPLRGDPRFEKIVASLAPKDQE